MVESVRTPAGPNAVWTPRMVDKSWHSLYQGLCVLHDELIGCEGIEDRVASVSDRAPLSVVAREYAQVSQNDFSAMPLARLYWLYTEVRVHRELLDFIAGEYSWPGSHTHSSEIFSAWFGSFHYDIKDINLFCRQMRAMYAEVTGLYYPYSHAPSEISDAEKHLAQAVLARLPSIDKATVFMMPGYVWRGTLLRRVNMRVDEDDSLRIVSFARDAILGGYACFTDPHYDAEYAIRIAVNGVQKDPLHGSHKRYDPILIGVPFDLIKNRSGVDFPAYITEIRFDPDIIASIDSVLLYHPE